MAKANVAGTTVYIPEGHPIPDLPGVRFVGPGAPDVEKEGPSTEAVPQEAPPADEKVPETPVNESQVSEEAPDSQEPHAPYGYKADGTPRKRPGRVPKDT